MKSILYLTVVASILVTQILVAQGLKEFRFDDGKYDVMWESVPGGVAIRFHLNIETTGWVGLGVSLNPNMTNSDLFIGGIRDADDTPYHNDYHGAGNGRPTVDAQNDWILDSSVSSQTETNTILTIVRLLKTADESGEDLEIPDARIYLLWAYGPTDEIDYHSAKRGSAIVNLINDKDVGTTESDITTTVTEAGGGGSRIFGSFSPIFIAVAIKALLKL